MAVGLWMTRPRDFLGAASTGNADAATLGCLSNLEKIGHAFALYARDYDGKFPRGTDPEDHNFPEIWNGPDNEFDGLFYRDAKTAPLLHELLRSYDPNREIWHCPADVGWQISRLPTLGESNLRNVAPSSFARFGTSYYVFTRYNFTLMTPADLENPGQTLILFDGDLWHKSSGKNSLNGLFADGSSRNLSVKQFNGFAQG